MLSIDNLRKGHTYILTNYGDRVEFEVIEFTSNDYLVKNIDTLEKFHLNELIEYGKGKDYELIELEEHEK